MLLPPLPAEEDDVLPFPPHPASIAITAALITTVMHRKARL
jgi:hypothetical protein